MRRLLLLLAGLASTLALTAVPAAAKTTTCVPASAATYRHSFNGAAGTLTVTETRPLCAGQSQSVTLASYTAAGPSGTAAGQFIYASATGKLTATNRSLTLQVAVPGCYAQVDAFFGTGAVTETTSTAAPYGTAKLGSASGLGARSTGPLTWHTGGATTCSPALTTTYAMACDGTFTATLANAPSANVAAVFVNGSTRVRLAPGASTTIKVAKSKTLSIRDSSFTTHMAVWRAPENCATAPGQAAPPASTTQPATKPSATASPTATSPSPSASSSPTPTYAEAPAAYPTFPDSKPTTAITKTGLSTGSLIAIALGLLMIGVGATALTWLIRMNRSLA